MTSTYKNLFRIILAAFSLFAFPIEYAHLLAAINAPVAIASEKTSAPSSASSSGSNASALGVISGRLIDDVTGEPLMFASIALHSAKDSLIVGGTITDDKGSFKLEQVPFGEYYLGINYVGYPRKEVEEIIVHPRLRTFDAGLISLAPAVSVLSEVTVQANRELMEVGLDRRVFNVDRELTATGGTALDLMQNIPSVAVDFDGNLSMRGSSNVTVLIDGRPSGLTGLSGSDALNQLPANMIERIEVITNPSARYSPDGTSGIINIVLKKERKPGYNGVLSLNASAGNRYNASANLNYRINRINIFANYSGRLSDMDGYGNSFRTSFLSETSYLDQQIDFTNKMNSQNFTIGADFQPNKFNTFTLSVIYNSWERSGENDMEYASLNSAMLPTGFFLRESNDRMNNNGLNYSLNYRRTFDQRNRELNADLVFSGRGMSRTEENLQRFMAADKSMTDRPDLLENTLMDGNNWMVSFQTDYVHPLGKDKKLEFGARAYIREMDSDFTFLRYNQGAGSWVNEPGLSNRFVFGEQVYSAYGTFGTTIGAYSFQAGLRAEQSYVEADQRTTGEVFNNSWFHLFPSAHLRRSFEKNQSAQLSYSRRINRPNNRVLNPFVSYSDPFDLQFGNPRLAPELINSIELGYTRFWKNTTVNPSLFYRYTDGMITRFRTMDENGIAYTTYENLNRGTSYGAEMVMSQQIFRWYRANATLSYFRQIVEGSGAMMEMRNDSYSWSFRMVNNLTFDKGWSAQINGFYRSPVVMLQGEMKEMYGADVAVRKNVLNNRGTITLRLSDIFNTQRFAMYNFGDNFTINTERFRDSRMLFVGFSYRINEMERRPQNRRQQQGGDDSMMDFDMF